MTQPIKLVLFDMEGVLSDYDRAARTARLADLTGRPPPGGPRVAALGIG